MKIFIILTFISSFALAEDKKPSPPKDLKEYCLKYPNSIECKPTQVKQKLDAIQQQENKKTEEKLKEIDN